MYTRTEVKQPLASDVPKMMCGGVGGCDPTVDLFSAAHCFQIRREDKRRMG